MDLYYKQEISVGLLVIASVVVFFLGLMWLRGTPFGSGGRVELQAQFEDVSGLTKGDPVLVSGFNVGRVGRVEFQGVGQVLVTLELQQDLPPHADAAVSVGALDFLGQMKIDYSPGVSPDMLPPGQVLVGTREAGLTEGVPQLKDQASQVLLGLQEFTTPETARTLNETMIAMRDALVRVSDLLGEFPRGTGTTMLEAMESARSATNHLDSILANPGIHESLNQLDELTESLQEMADGLAGATTSLSAIMAKIDSGQGSLGLALTDSTLHTDLHDLMTAITLLVDDMRERPGRYFRLKVF